MIGRRVMSPRPTTEMVLLTFKEAMDFLRVSRSTIYRLMWSGQLRGHKVGSTWRFYESDLLAAVDSPLPQVSEEQTMLVQAGRQSAPAPHTGSHEGNPDSRAIEG